MKKLLFFLISSFVLFSCVKQEFDEPPAEGVQSTLKANKTIKELRDFHKPGAFDKITEDWIIEGVVVADDQSGNYYKTIVIQDATGGIDVKLDANSLYNDYPIGRKIYIKCKDLTISDYNNLVQLGGGTFKNNNGQDQLAGIEQLLIPSFVVKGEKDQKVTPREITIPELTPDMMSTLITLKGVQFETPGETYADAPKKATLNKNITDCDNFSIVLRSSGYASFANEKLPDGKGTITGIFTQFGTTNQFYIRDISDVKLTETRCGGGGVGGKLIAIGDLIAAFKAGQTTIAAGTKIAGSVITDRAGKNINGQNLVLQGDDNKGIIVRFSATHNFALGEALEINVGGGVLSQYQGALQVTAGSPSNGVKTGTNLITPKKMTLAQFVADFDNIESTLVQIENASASTTSKFAGNITLTDASGGSATLFTYNTASTVAAFANDPLPSNVINVVGVASKFNSTLQIQMRNLADATQGSGGGGTGGTATQKSIADVRAVFTGTKTKCPNNTFIKGIVISDKDTKNINDKNLILQEPNGKGILVRFSAAHSFALGEEIQVEISGIELSEFNALLQVNGVPLGNGKKTGTGSIIPKELTIKELIDNFENYESTLVLIKNAEFPTPAAAKFAGTIKLNDGTGTIDLFTATGNATSTPPTPPATFAASVPPVGAKSVTAIVTQFKSATTTTNGYQIQIRNESDIK